MLVQKLSLFRPMFERWKLASSADDLKSLQVTGAAERSMTLSQQLDPNAPDRPDINRARVSLVSQKHFWSAVPSRHHIMR